jgi:hypothetical protein
VAGKHLTGGADLRWLRRGPRWLLLLSETVATGGWSSTSDRVLRREIPASLSSGRGAKTGPGGEYDRGKRLGGETKVGGDGIHLTQARTRAPSVAVTSNFGERL